MVGATLAEICGSLNFSAGDLDGDGLSNVVDVVELIDVVVNGMDLEDCEMWTIDMDTNESLDIFDVVALVESIVSVEQGLVVPIPPPPVE